MGSGHLGQAELYPDYWNFKIILGKWQHIVNKVLKSRIRMYGCLYLINFSEPPNQISARKGRLSQKCFQGPYPSYFMEFGRSGTNDPGEAGHQEVRIFL